MKKQILSIVLGLVMMAIGTTTYAADKNSNSGKRAAATEKALKNFNKQFKSAVNTIINPSEDGFIVRSEINGHKITSAYNKRGNWVYTINGYSVTSLDKNIMEIAMPGYANYFITAMEKVDQPGDNSVYIVHIEGSKSFKTLRVSNNVVELVEDFTKA
ncbi:MAG TPA: hypothetical protein VGP55_17055 [Chitinophagaceae bacterium]|nr:hypothetical protein [Chitinophagaceae bacterium]